MSLQKEIDKLIIDLSCDYHDIDSASKFINKVLDAAMQAIIDCEGRESKFNHIEAIGKLRPKS